jgi:hypothetical protein
VTVTHEGKTTVLEVPSDKSILEAALDKGVDLPHDCKLGVCMTCPAKLVRPRRRGWRGGVPGAGAPACAGLQGRADPGCHLQALTLTLAPSRPSPPVPPAGVWQDRPVGLHAE